MLNSIVIVNFNAKAALLTLLKSLRLEESTGGEVIVVDSASHDGSIEVAQHFPAVKLLPLKTNRGFFAAANKGINQAKGDVVVLCHADIIADIHTLTELADEARIGEGRKIAAVFPRILAVDDSDQPFVGFLPTLVAAVKGTVFAPAGLKCHVPMLDHLTEDEWARFVCVAFNRDYLATTGLLDEKFFLYCGDTDLCARMHKKKMRIAISKSVKVKHAGAGISREIPSHLRRILRNDQHQYAKKYLPAWQNSIVQALGATRKLLDRSS